jgi:hypothetical protein
MNDHYSPKRRRTDRWTNDDHSVRGRHDPESFRGGRGRSYLPNYTSDDAEAFANGRGQSYRPSHAARDRKPRSNESYKGGRGASYRPNYNSGEGHVPKNQPSSAENPSLNSSNVQSSRTEEQQAQNKPASNAHTKRSRKENPSSRIHSLRKQLAHVSAATLPANVLAEKERELQFLLSQQTQTQHARDRKRKVGRYHMVRFFERKKSERWLKKARKRAGSLEEDTNTQGTSEQREAAKIDVRRREVDLLYCLYSPLEDKYISLFADANTNEANGNGATPKSKKRRRGQDEAEAAEKQAIAQAKDDALGNPELVKLAVAPGDSFRPPVWYAIKKIVDEVDDTNDNDVDQTDMVQIPADNDAFTSVSLSKSQIRRLEAMRDAHAADKAADGVAESLVVRPKKKASDAQAATTPAWMTETDQPIDAADADEDGDEDGGMRLEGDGEDDSDGDGGFFQR